MLKVALVTGAGRGIGRSIAERLLADGFHVIGADLDPSAVEDWGASSSAGDRLTAAELDVAKPASVERLFDEIDRTRGRVDVLVNNAGIVRFKPVVDLTDDDWSTVLRVNLDGVFYCSRAAARRMTRAGSGAIINISSVSATIGSAERGAYSASKAGVLGLTRVMAAELGVHGIGVNAILPGTIETALGDAALDDALLSAFRSRTPAGRRGTGDEIAGVVSFLASADASYVTGQSIAVDGGYLGAGLLLDDEGRPRT